MITSINQRDVYLLPRLSSSIEEHLYIVLSILACNEYERTFIGIMITSSEDYYDDYSFGLTDDMFEKPLDKKNSHARMHLLTLWMNEEIIGKKINTMKPFYFKQLMASIGELIFNYKFEPL